MEIVIEYVLLDNCIIDFFVLFLTSKFLNLNHKTWRLIVSVVYAAILALVFPLLNLSIFLQIVFKLLVAITMLLIAFKFFSFKNFVAIFLVFISITCLFGGLCIMISLLEFGTLDAMTVGLYSKNIPMGLITLIIACYVFIVKGVVDYIKTKNKLSKFIYTITLKTEFKKITINAYLDSAHNLVDPITNQSVVIVNYSTFNKLFKIPIENILSQTLPSLPNAHYINYKTINSGSAKMLVFEIKELTIKNFKKNISKQNQMVGLSFSNFKKNFNCDALISAELF